MAQSSFMDQLGSGIGAGLSAGIQSSSENFARQVRTQEENEALKRFGLDLSGISDPDIRKSLIQNTMKKKVEDTEKFSVALQTLDQMQEIRNRGNLGVTSGIRKYLSKDTARDTAEYEALGRSLIPLVAAGVPVRNRQEFEEYKKVITDPSALESEIDGAIEGLTRIFNEKLQKDEKDFASLINPKEEKIEPEKFKKVIFSPKNKEHQAKATQLFKHYLKKGLSKEDAKKKVREDLSREFEGL